MLITVEKLLERIDISPKLIYLINSQYKKMIGQVRYSLGMLNGITKLEISRIFNTLDINPNDLNDMMNQYPENVYVMRQPIYNILALIMIKAYMVGNDQLARDTNNLLGLVLLARLKYKYIRVINHEVLDRTIMTLTKKTYIGMHGTAWMVHTICKNTHDKWIADIMKDPTDNYARYRYIIDMRNKFNQIMKTVARAYYYNITHKDEVDLSTKLRNRTDAIMEHLSTKSIPIHILQYAADLCNVHVDHIGNLNHDIQIYNSMQMQISVVISNILYRLNEYMTIYKDQYGKNIDINDSTFIKSFYVSLKRSTIVLKSVSNEIFTSRGYDRFEVLSYALVITLYVDSTLNSNKYATSSVGSIDYASQYDNDYPITESVDNTVELMMDGILV